MGITGPKSKIEENSFVQGGPIKTTHFLRYHIFAATKDIIVRFLLKCSEITAENNKRQFFLTSVKYCLQLVKIWYLVNVSANRLEQYIS